jgi:uncharacterized membrane protein YjgN (DUF898 family)
MFQEKQNHHDSRSWLRYTVWWLWLLLPLPAAKLPDLNNFGATEDSHGDTDNQHKTSCSVILNLKSLAHVIFVILAHPAIYIHIYIVFNRYAKDCSANREWNNKHNPWWVLFYIIIMNLYYLIYIYIFVGITKTKCIVMQKSSLRSCARLLTWVSRLKMLWIQCNTPKSHSE